MATGRQTYAIHTSHLVLTELLDVGFAFFPGDVNILPNFGDCFIRGLHIDDDAIVVGSANYPITGESRMSE
jgi:hypothetical protein